MPTGGEAGSHPQVWPWCERLAGSGGGGLLGTGRGAGGERKAGAAERLWQLLPRALLPPPEYTMPRAELRPLASGMGRVFPSDFRCEKKTGHSTS